jgi:DNA recombination protein Rad52
MTPETIDELQKPLDKRHVKPPRQYGPKGDYIEGWHAIAEANRIFGHDAWSYEIADCKCVSERPREIGRERKQGFGVSYIATVRVMVGSVVREDVGSGHGYDIDAGLAHESAIKEAVTDALKRALRTFGWPFGLALYDKARENVSDETAAAPPPRGRGAGGDISPSPSAPTPSADPADLYVEAAIKAMQAATSAADLKAWWADESSTRDDFGITKGTRRYDALWQAFLARGKALSVSNVITSNGREMHPLEAG